MLFIVDYQNNAICKGGSEHGNMDINARRLSDNAGGGGLFVYVFMCHGAERRKTRGNQQRWKS